MRDSAVDTQWIEAVVDRFEKPLTGYVYRLLGDLERARDVVQESFCRLWDRAVQKDDRPADDKLAPWLYTVCRNLATDIRRKEQRMTRLTEMELDERSTAAHPPDHDMQQADELAAALTLLGELPDNQQEVIRLKFSSSLTYQQISEVTGLSISHVGFLLHTGLKKLRQRLGQEAE